MKVLYFIRGVPSDQQRQEAGAIGAVSDQNSTAPVTDLASMTLAELKGLAKERSIAIPAVMRTKAEIIDFLTKVLAESAIK